MYRFFNSFVVNKNLGWTCATLTQYLRST